MHGYGLMGGASGHTTKRGARHNPAARRHDQKDPTLQHPRCVDQLLRKHFARYTPEVVSQICGCTPEEIDARSPNCCAQNSGRERTSAIVYAVGWTQHTTGVADHPRRRHHPAAAGQHRPARRRDHGHARPLLASRAPPTSPPSTTCCPATCPSPPCDQHHETLDGYCRVSKACPPATGPTRSKFIVSLLKAYYGDAATTENDYRFDWLPAHRRRLLAAAVLQEDGRGEREGVLPLRPEPRRRRAQRRPAPRRAAAARMAGRRRLVRDRERRLLEERPQGPAGPTRSRPKSSSSPPPPSRPRRARFTNTQRLIQWHDKAVDPEGDCRSDLWFVWQPGPAAQGAVRRLDQAAGPGDPGADLGLRLRRGAAPARRLAQPDRRRAGRRRRCCRRSTAYFVNQTDEKTGKPKLLNGFSELQGRRHHRLRRVDLLRHLPRATTATAPASAVTGNNPLQPEWGYAWPHNRRIMYNRASGRPAGPAVVGAEEADLVGRGGEEVGRPRRAGLRAGQAARLPPAAGRQGDGRHRRRPAVHHEARRRRLAVRRRRRQGRPVPHALRAGRIAGAATCCTRSRTTARRRGTSRGR